MLKVKYVCKCLLDQDQSSLHLAGSGLHVRTNLTGSDREQYSENSVTRREWVQQRKIFPFLDYNGKFIHGIHWRMLKEGGATQMYQRLRYHGDGYIDRRPSCLPHIFSPMHHRVLQMVLKFLERLTPHQSHKYLYNWYYQRRQVAIIWFEPTVN